MALAVPLFSRIEYFCQGRLSHEDHVQSGHLTPHSPPLRTLPMAHDPNEDRVWARTYPVHDGVTALLAADGVTKRTPWLVKGRPAGWWAAEILVNIVHRLLGPDMTPTRLWAEILHNWRAFELLHNCPAEEQLRATAVLFNPFVGEIWFVGDGLFGWELPDGSWVPSTSTFPPNGPDAIARATAIREALALPQLVFPNDLQRWRREIYHVGWEALQAGRRQRQLGLAPVDSLANTMTPERWNAGFERIPVPPCQRLMLGSDGVQLPCRTVAEGLQRLQQWAAFDPWVLGLAPLNPAVHAAFLNYLHRVDGQPQWPKHTKGFIDENGVQRPLLDDTALLIATL